MLIKRPADIRSSEITDKKLYSTAASSSRAAGGPLPPSASGVLGAGCAVLHAGAAGAARQEARRTSRRARSAHRRREVNSWEQITTYNNYYEFGIDKDSPAELARDFKTEPWTVASKASATRRRKYLARRHPEGRDARRARLPAPLRRSVVDGHSVGRHSRWRTSSSAASRRRRRSSSSSRRSTMRSRCPALRPTSCDWPYVEGLRHGRSDAPADDPRRRPVRRGAAEPERRADPAGRAVEVRLQARQVDREDRVRREAAAQHLAGSAPHEYGFYANVNPKVDHPRWSQATERRIGEFFRRKTLMFNGYGDQVASLYTGMDLQKNY